MVGETVTTSEKLRDDYYFLLSLKEVSIESKQLGIDEPALGQKKKASQRIEDDLVALQSVSFIKNSKILTDKFTLKYWVTY